MRKHLVDYPHSTVASTKASSTEVMNSRVCFITKPFGWQAVNPQGCFLPAVNSATYSATYSQCRIAQHSEITFFRSLSVGNILRVDFQEVQIMADRVLCTLPVSGTPQKLWYCISRKIKPTEPLPTCDSCHCFTDLLRGMVMVISGRQVRYYFEYYS